MGTPAVVQGDLITGTCNIHLVPGPSGAQPAPPLPFSAPLTTGLAATVVIGGKPAAVQGASGTNQPTHTGLHPNDPDQLSAAQLGRPPQQARVVAGSATVFFDSRPAAFAGCNVTICMGAPGQVAGTAATVLVAG